MASAIPASTDGTTGGACTSDSNATTGGPGVIAYNVPAESVGAPIPANALSAGIVAESVRAGRVVDLFA